MSDTDESLNDDGHDLGDIPVWRAIAVMAGPMLFGIAAVMSVSMIDTLFIGQLGKTQLAALAFAFPVTTVVSGLSLGLSAGASSVVSRAVGEDDAQGARSLSLHSLILAIIISTSIALIGAAITEPLFKMLGASADSLEYITEYMRIWFIAVPFLTVAMMCDFIVRATGNSFWPSLIMTVGSVINIGVTALLVFGLAGLPELGVTGAATGTLIAQMLTVLGGLWMVTFKTEILRWELPKLKTLLPSWWDLAKVAAPASLGQMVHPLTLTAITAILAGFSENIVAAFGVATQIEVIATIPLLALSSALSPIAGQNWGSGQVDRIRRSLHLSYWASVVWAAIIAVPLWLFGEQIAGVFNSDGGIPEEAQTYLRVVPFSLFGYGMVICAAAAFNGIDQATRSLGFNIVRSAGLFLPLSFIGARMFDAPGVYYGIAAANVVAGLAVGWYALHWLRDHKAGEAPQDEPDGDDGYLVPAE